MNHWKCIGTIGTMFGDWPKQFAKSYKDFMAFNNRYLCGPNEYIKEVEATVSWHSSGRNELVEKTEGEWLFQLDTDHIFHPDLLYRLLNEQSLGFHPIISGLYLNKHPGSGHVPVANVKREDGSLAQLTEWPRGARQIPVANVGGGCLLVKTYVFNKIRSEFKEMPFDLVQGLSEDYSFCKKASDLGFPITLCPQIECHHYTPHVLSKRDFNFEK